MMGSVKSQLPKPKVRPSCSCTRRGGRVQPFPASEMEICRQRFVMKGVDWGVWAAEIVFDV